MAARLGDVLFLGGFLAVLLLFFVVLDAGHADDVSLYIGGGIIVFIGWALRYILAGR